LGLLGNLVGGADDLKSVETGGGGDDESEEQILDFEASAKLLLFP